MQTTIFIGIGLLIVGSLLALTASDVIQFLFNAAELLFVLSPICIFLGFGLFKQSQLLDILISIGALISVVVYIYMFLNDYFADMILMYIPVLLNTAFCIAAIIVNKFCCRACQKPAP